MENNRAGVSSKDSLDILTGKMVQTPVEMLSGWDVLSECLAADAEPLKTLNIRLLKNGRYKSKGQDSPERSS